MLRYIWFFDSFMYAVYILGKTIFRNINFNKIWGWAMFSIHIMWVHVWVCVCACVCVCVFLLVHCNTDSIGKLSTQTKKTRWLELGYKPFCCSHINQFSLFKCNKIHIISVAPTYCLWTYKERRFLSINSDPIKKGFTFVFLNHGTGSQVWTKYGRVLALNKFSCFGIVFRFFLCVSSTTLTKSIWQVALLIFLGLPPWTKGETVRINAYAYKMGFVSCSLSNMCHQGKGALVTTYVALL